ncbi:MAG: RNA methyltransferase [Rhodospirillaceae bacterium]|nr:RNA methyltransferase [Rhodospirillaceae bacterium]
MDLPHLTSLQNDHVKRARALDRRKERKESGLFLAEGAKVIATARDAGWPPETLFVDRDKAAGGIVAELVAWARRNGAACHSITPKIAEALSARDNPQPVIGVFKQRWAAAPDPARLNAGDVWVALEEVRDPGNLGTIIRTADAAGASGVVLVGTTCDPYARESVRATMGSVFAVPLAQLTHEGFLDLVRAWPGESVATHLAASTDHRRDYRGPVLLAMGSEGPGLSDAVAGACSVRVRIPMAADTGADSLNLAVATALMIYEIKRASLPLA